MEEGEVRPVIFQKNPKFPQIKNSQNGNYLYFRENKAKNPVVLQILKKMINQIMKLNPKKSIQLKIEKDPYLLQNLDNLQKKSIRKMNQITMNKKKILDMLSNQKNISKKLIRMINQQ